MLEIREKIIIIRVCVCACVRMCVCACESDSSMPHYSTIEYRISSIRSRATIFCCSFFLCGYYSRRAFISHLPLSLPLLPSNVPKSWVPNTVHLPPSTFLQLSKTGPHLLPFFFFSFLSPYPTTHTHTHTHTHTLTPLFSGLGSMCFEKYPSR